jgi:hypothetical protein
MLFFDFLTAGSAAAAAGAGAAGAAAGAGFAPGAGAAAGAAGAAAAGVAGFAGVAAVCANATIPALINNEQIKAFFNMVRTLGARQKRQNYSISMPKKNLIEFAILNKLNVLANTQCSYFVLKKFHLT